MKSGMYMIQMRFIKTTVVVVFVGLTTVLSFQNCSPVQFYDLTEASRLAALEIERVGAAEETVTAGINEVPELKMVFVVDNSGTMRQNQLNLADSFGSMFDSSSNSLNRFDSTTFLINTAQALPVYQNDSEKNSLFEAISSQQNSFNSAASVPKATFDSSFRSNLQNFGAIPGDNLGFSLKKSTNPLTYEILPAAVMGASEVAGQVSLKGEIRMPANSNVAQIESEFKNRLAIMNADRIPQFLVSNQYVPQHNTIVDNESGLCSVARILRNPTNYFKPGELVSFTLVSDENDNNPSGDRCVQSVRELVGTEKLIDLDCKKNSTSISYQPPNVSVVPDKCSTNGQIGYNFKFTFTKPNIQKTTVEYLWLKSAAKFTSKYYSLKYKKVSGTSYQYLHTKVVYYLEQCYDVYSDGNKIGTRCNPKSSPEAAQYVSGNQVANCLNIAKSFNAAALNSPAPVCTTEDRPVTSCNTGDSLCKSTTNYTEVTAVGSPFAGPVPSTSACASQASGFGDYSKDAICALADKTDLANCSNEPAAAQCYEATARVTEYKKETPDGDQRGSDSCLTWAKGRSGNLVNDSAQIKTCSFSSTPGGVGEASSSINFLKNGNPIDVGTTLGLGDCGVIKSAAYDLVKSNSSILPSDSCVITGYKLAGNVDVTRTLATCSLHADKRCTDDKLRSCTSSLIAGSTTDTNDPARVFKTVTERLSCNSKCSDSAFQFCDVGTAPTTLISDFLKSKYGARTICSVSASSVVETDKVSLTKQLESEKETLCKPSTSDGAPRYPYVTRSTYYSKDKIIDFVAGTAANDTAPAQNLISYIKSRIAALNANQFIFTALVQKSSDPAPAIGSKGVEYERLITETGGSISRQVDSIKAADYSVALKELSSILKSNLERTFTLKNMRADQIITQVTLIKKSNQAQVVLPRSQWLQAGKTLKIAPTLEFLEGDQFKVDYQNDVN
jgi:hypothetical protein